MWRKGNPPTLLVEREVGARLWRTARRFLKKLKIEWQQDSAVPHLGIYPDKTVI